MHLFDEYQSGENERTWRRLTALGSLLRSDPYVRQAESIAAETMKRAAHNLHTIITRLQTLGFKFTYPQSPLTGQPDAVLIRHGEKASYSVTAYNPPAANVDGHLESVEAILGAIPISLRAWYRSRSGF